MAYLTDTSDSYTTADASAAVSNTTVVTDDTAVAGTTTANTAVTGSADDGVAVSGVNEGENAAGGFVLSLRFLPL